MNRELQRALAIKDLRQLVREYLQAEVDVQNANFSNIVERVERRAALYVVLERMVEFKEEPR